MRKSSKTTDCWIRTRLLRLAAGVCLLWTAVPSAEARPWRPGQIPNGDVFDCQTCHVNANPNLDGTRNLFGVQVEMFVSPFGVEAFWPSVRELDADTDGFTNGQELQEPAVFLGDFTDPPPPHGNPSCVSDPADAASTPPGGCFPDPSPTPALPSPSPNPSPTPPPSPTSTAAPCCPGDANNSGSFVDANDFIGVQANFGADNGIGGAGDANCSGSFVDANDFIAVQANFGSDCG